MRALLMIDAQNGFLDPKQPIRNNKDAEKNMLRLMEHFRKKEIGQLMSHFVGMFGYYIQRNSTRHCSPTLTFHIHIIPE